MKGSDNAPQQQRLQKSLELLERFRTIDDTFMRQVFKDNEELTEYVLRVLTNIRDLIVVRQETQRDLKRLAGSRSLELDVWATDPSGTQYDLEVQRSDDASPQRLRYHSAAMDVESLKPRRPFSDLHDQWVIFVMENDPEPGPTGVRHYVRADLLTGNELGDGTHLLYIDGGYRGNDELGSLMADFCQSDPDLIQNELLRKRVQYLKRDPEGVREMCRISEEIYSEGLKEGRVEGRVEGREESLLQSVRQLVQNVGWSAKEALDKLGVPESEQKRYLSML